MRLRKKYPGLSGFAYRTVDLGVWFSALSAALLMVIALQRLYTGNYMVGMIAFAIQPFLILNIYLASENRRWNAGRALLVCLAITCLATVIITGRYSSSPATTVTMLVALAVLLESGFARFGWIVVAASLLALSFWLKYIDWTLLSTLDTEWEFDSTYRAAALTTVFALLVAEAYRYTIAQTRTRTARTQRRRRRQINRNRKMEARFRDFATMAADVLWETDRQGVLTFVSDRFSELTRTPVSAVIGRPAINALRAFATDPSELETVSASLASREAFEYDSLTCRIEGRLVQLSISATPTRSSAGEFAGMRGVVRDVTAQAAARERLEELARTDQLTGVLNRRAFLDQCQDRLTRFRGNESPAAIAYIDLDHFKKINDDAGHSAGDRMLANVGKVLNAVGEDCLVGRIGGDEFGVFFDDHDSVSAAVQQLSHDLKGLSLIQDGQAYRIGASIGVYAEEPVNLDDISEWIRRADKATYAAKSKGRNQVVYFSSNSA